MRQLLGLAEGHVVTNVILNIVVTLKYILPHLSIAPQLQDPLAGPNLPV
ncbi:MAG: hypothetical protein II930_07925 [Lachnospiraceae bacterium]|nr:hypothetical protein [Lachnospiraceae bacterium]